MEQVQDEMTVAFKEQIADDFSKKMSAADTQFVRPPGYYLGQYKKHTIFASDIETFTSKKDGSTFANPFYHVPVGAFVFDLLGVASRKNDPIVQWEKPSGYSFKACFEEVLKFEKPSEESRYGGYLKTCAEKGGCTSNATSDVLNWLENHMVILHIDVMKASADGKYPEKNILRSVVPYNG